MYPKNKTLDKAINTLYEKLKDKEYGKSFTWEELKNMTGVGNELSQDNIYYIANKVCLLLMASDRRYLATQIGIGKRIVSPGEHGVIAKKKVKKSVKIYRRAGQVLAATNMDELTPEQQKQIINDANKYATLEMFAKEVLQKKKIGISSKEDLSKASLFLDAVKLFSKK